MAYNFLQHFTDISIISHRYALKCELFDCQKVYIDRDLETIDIG